jgi:HD superfamily phosphodiesterase
MKQRIRKLIPEIEWIHDESTREKVTATIEDGLRSGGWEPEDMDKMPFTLLIPDCPASLLAHTRSIVQMSHHIGEVYNPIYDGQGDFTLDHDVLVAGAILHDVGKLVEMEFVGGKYVKAQYGKDLRHPFSGAILASRNGISSDICHVIATHAGEGNGRHRSPEAVVVHHVDFINFESIKSHLGLL